MPEGSSSAAPVTSPGPSNRSTMLRGFLVSTRLGSAIECPGAWNKVESATLADNDNRYFAAPIKQILNGRPRFRRQECGFKIRWRTNANRSASSVGAVRPEKLVL